MERYGCVKFSIVSSRDTSTTAYKSFSTIYFYSLFFHERAGEHEVHIVCELLVGCFEQILLT